MARAVMQEALPAGVARRIRLIVLDVDGVLTDGGLYIGGIDGAGGEQTHTVEMKRFDITDQLGIKMLVWSGLTVVMVSGRSSAGNRLRGRELGIPVFEAPGGYKLQVVERIQQEHGVGWEETACVCDDLADLPLIRRAGLGVAVASAVPEVRDAARWITRRSGGHGAVREFAEALLRARGEWEAAVDRYVSERESVSLA